MWPCNHGWMLPPLHPSLAGGEIHVWCISLDASPAKLAVLSELLSADERERAARFHFEKDRCRYSVAHALLRQILSRYTGRAAVDFRFDLVQNGKPVLPAAYGGDTLQFNLSHSSNLGLVAIANHRELGVDLEWIRPLDDLEQIAKNFFSARECEQLFELDAHLRLT